jgi:integrase/recombinase XerD
MSSLTSKVTEVWVTGILAPFAARFREGYTPLSAANVMRLMAHLSRWLEVNSSLEVAEPPSEQVQCYAVGRRAEGRTSPRMPRSVVPILAMLADAGALVPAAPAAPMSEQDKLPAGFERHLHCVSIACALGGLDGGSPCFRALRFLPGPDDGGLAGLTAGDVTRAVLAEAEMVCRRTQRSTSSPHCASDLRSRV